MKFVAFLRDSYKEAKSGWVLQAMLVLALLLILFIASISFRPTTMNDELTRSFGLVNWAFRQNPEFKGTTLTVENFSATNEKEPWKSDFAFDIVLTAPSEKVLTRLRENPGMPTTKRRIERMLKDGYYFLDTIEVTESARPAPAEKDKPADDKAAKDDVKQESRFGVKTSGNKSQERMSWLHVPSILFGIEVPFLTMSYRQGIYTLENYLVNYVAVWVLLVIGVVVTADIVPNMLRKGALDLLIAKPLSRVELLVYKYIGGLMFVFLLTSFTVVGIWAVIGLRTGIWSPNFLAAIPVVTFYFAILYAVSTLAAVLTRHTLVAILVTIVAWGLIWAVGKVNDGIGDRREAIAAWSEKGGEPDLPIPKKGEKEPTLDDVISRIDPDAPLWGFIPKLLWTPLEGLHAVTPRAFDLDGRLGRIIAEGVLTEPELKKSGFDKPPRNTWAGTVGVSLAFIAVCLGLASWRFVTRDG